MREKLTKPICKYCKHKRITGFPSPHCFKERQMNEVGDWLYRKCSSKNADFQCTDFEPKLLYRKTITKELTNGN